MKEKGGPEDLAQVVRVLASRRDDKYGYLVITPVNAWGILQEFSRVEGHSPMASCQGLPFPSLSGEFLAQRHTVGAGLSGFSLAHKKGPCAPAP